MELGRRRLSAQASEPRELLACIRAISCAVKAARARRPRQCRHALPAAWKSIAMPRTVSVGRAAGRPLTSLPVRPARGAGLKRAGPRADDARSRSWRKPCAGNWRPSTAPSTCMLGRIRAAIETDPRLPKRILTVRGVGYVFRQNNKTDEAAALSPSACILRHLAGGSSQRGRAFRYCVAWAWNIAERAALRGTAPRRPRARWCSKVRAVLVEGRGNRISSSRGWRAF